MSGNTTQAAPSILDTVRTFAAGVPEEQRPDALQELFYGFYARIAIVDRSTAELARWAKEEIAAVPDVPAPLADALRDNALFVGRELFATRIRTMSAMGYVAAELRALRDAGGAPPSALARAVAFDEQTGTVRSYDLATPGEHPDLPYDPYAYDPQADD
jgi:hypothetical protein